MNRHYKVIKRIIITGKMDEHRKALQYCYKNSYRVVRSGMRVNRGEGRYDNTRYKIIGEREVD